MLHIAENLAKIPPAIYSHKYQLLKGKNEKMLNKYILFEQSKKMRLSQFQIDEEKLVKT